MEGALRVFVAPAVAASVTIAVLFAVRGIFFRLLHRWALTTKTEIDDAVIHSFKTPSIYWVLAVGIYAGIWFSALPERHVFYLSKSIHVLIVLSITFAVANLLGRLYADYIRRSALPIPTTGLVQGLLKGIILVLGFLIILSMLGVSITPLITALGIGGLAVALALQDTLANLFAGIHILVEKSVRVGDFVRLESGQEGFVADITWRTTRIRMLPNNMVVIPNSKLAQSIVTNYFLPEKRMSVLIPVSVSYSSDPGYVEKVLVEEARKAIGEVEGLLAEPEPFVRFIPGFGESSLDFTLICQVREFTDQYLVQHELRKRIFRRFGEENIEIPFPQRTVHLKTGAGEKEPRL